MPYKDDFQPRDDHLSHLVLRTADELATELIRKALAVGKDGPPTDDEIDEAVCAVRRIYVVASRLSDAFGYLSDVEVEVDRRRAAREKLEAEQDELDEAEYDAEVERLRRASPLYREAAASCDLDRDPLGGTRSHGDQKAAGDPAGTAPQPDPAKES